MEKGLIHLNGKCLLSEKGGAEGFNQKSDDGNVWISTQGKQRRKEQDKMIGEAERRLGQVGLVMKKEEKLEEEGVWKGWEWCRANLGSQLPV